MRSALAILLLLTSLLVSSCSAPTPAREADPILVMAASSLTDAMADVVRIYESLPPNAGGEDASDQRVDLDFGSSLRLRRQIERGAAADVFISASATHMDALDSSGALLPGTRVALLRNQIVVATTRLDPAPDGDLDTGTDGELARRLDRGEKVGVAEPGVPVGDYAREALESLGLWNDLRSRVVPLPNERAVLQAVARGAVDWGVVYRSSTIDRGHGVNVSVWVELPAESHRPVVYPGAVLRVSSQPSRARAFLAFLQSEVATRIFREHGFTVDSSAGSSSTQPTSSGGE